MASRMTVDGRTIQVVPLFQALQLDGLDGSNGHKSFHRSWTESVCFRWQATSMLCKRMDLPPWPPKAFCHFLGFLSSSVILFCWRAAGRRTISVLTTPTYRAVRTSIRRASTPGRPSILILSSPPRLLSNFEIDDNDGQPTQL
jgi:hypothetical protein